MFPLESAGLVPLPIPGASVGLLVPATATRSVEDVFTLRWCHVLADALHKRTRWPVVVVGDGPGGHVGWVHAGVRMPDGRILDVEGGHDPGDWLTQWGPAVDEFGRDYMDHMDGDYDGQAVGIYERHDINSDVDFGVQDLPPADVLDLAARTADRILADLGWTAPPDAAPKS